MSLADGAMRSLGPQLAQFIRGGQAAQRAIDRQLSINVVGPPPPAPTRPPSPARSRSGHYKVKGRFPGAPDAKVSIVLVGGDWMLRVRVKGKRQTFERSLGELARALVLDVERLQAAERRWSRRRKKGLR